MRNTSSSTSRRPAPELHENPREVSVSPRSRRSKTEAKRRSYAREARKYDQDIDFWERKLFGPEHRQWACSRAVGDTLEVAIGTGLNLPHYPPGVRLTGLDLTPEMLAVAETRAQSLGRDINLREGDAHDLPFDERSFDTVVCTYAMCSVLDEVKVIAEMNRVLRAGGRLILVDHVRSTVKPLLWLQRIYEFIPSRTKGEYMTRRPALHVVAAGLEIEEGDRLRAGVIERLVARKH
ncbi:MAG: methyltransferase domain-containing protein [Actinobacteria bacterium]|nr:methyltransferase domain-containing protein [Actinomycetota bacterium]